MGGQPFPGAHRAGGAAGADRGVPTRSPAGVECDRDDGSRGRGCGARPARGLEGRQRGDALPGDPCPSRHRSARGAGDPRAPALHEPEQQHPVRSGPGAGQHRAREAMTAMEGLLVFPVIVAFMAVLVAGLLFEGRPLRGDLLDRFEGTARTIKGTIDPGTWFRQPRLTFDASGCPAVITWRRGRSNNELVSNLWLLVTVRSEEHT